MRSDLTGLTSIDIDRTIQSGQVFLWEKHRNSWYGVQGNHVLKVSRNEDNLPELASYPYDFGSAWSRLFRLDDNFEQIVSSISFDSFVKQLCESYPGLRLLRQDPYQSIVSFLCASNTNIQMIRLMLSRLCKKLGTAVSVDGMTFYTFPPVEKLAGCSIDDLRSCGLGFRAKAVSMAASSITDGQIDFDFLRKATYLEARESLKEIYGIGNKIADCILLFAFDKLESFPIDVWISRVLQSHFDWVELSRDHLTSKQYESLSESARAHFGQFAGYAQQYLYYYVRESAGRKW